MLIEQAFFYLPEVLLGASYPTQEYEGGIVGAFAMALLTALNGRNANNPLSLVQMERLWQQGGIPGPDGNGRRLRADLHFNADPLGTRTDALERYGWIPEYWLEAKYFRLVGGAAVPTSSVATANTAALLGDLIRLCFLPEDQVATPTRAGRYLLHVYDRAPRAHLAPEKKRTSARGIHPATPRFSRRWVTGLVSPGRQTLSRFRLNQENKTFCDALGYDLRAAEFRFGVTNLVIEPRSSTSEGPRLVLTRVDSAFAGVWGSHATGFTHSTAVREKAAGHYADIRSWLASALAIKGPAVQADAG